MSDPAVSIDPARSKSRSFVADAALLRGFSGSEQTRLHDRSCALPVDARGDIGSARTRIGAL